MCTIVILHRVHPDFPVVIAANREEFYSRVATAPTELEPGVYGGRDEVSGGTWMGVTAQGFFAGITNQKTYVPADPTLLSRGPVVTDALRAGSTAAVTAQLEALDPRRYNEFNLLYGDADGLRAAYARRTDDRMRFEDVPDGVHALPNDVLDSPEFPKADRMRALAESVVTAPWSALTRALRDLLADHHKPPLREIPEPPPGAPFSRERAQAFQAMCVHAGNYGTRSSAIIALQPGQVAHYVASHGPPCEAPMVEVEL